MPKQENTTPDYLRAAKANLDEANRCYSPEQFAGHISAAQAQATIALAEEQRTANLIAYTATLWQTGRGARAETIDAQVAERLGLS